MNYEKLWNDLKDHYESRVVKMVGTPDKIGYQMAKSVTLVMWHMEQLEKEKQK